MFHFIPLNFKIYIYILFLIYWKIIILFVSIFVF